MIAEQATPKTAKSQAFINQFIVEQNNETALFSSIREEARLKLLSLEIPTTRDESWRYTRLTKLTNQKFIPANLKQALNSNIIVEDDIDAVFIDGVFLLENHLKDSCFFSDIFQAYQHFPQHFNQYFGKLNSNKNFFESLNSSSFNNGFTLIVPKNVRRAKPIKILVSLNTNQLGINLKNFIFLEEGSEAQIQVEYQNNATENVFLNQTTEIIVEQNARFTFNQVSKKTAGLNVINQTVVNQQKSSFFQSNLFQFGGNLVRNNIQINQLGEHTETHLYGLNFSKQQNHIDNHTFINHALPNGYSSELYRSVLAGQSTGVFNGKILVNQYAQKTNAFQANNNILLSDLANMNAKPELEIYANDVKCSHGSTTGQLDDEALFYLQARGIPKPEAVKLLVKAFAHEVANKLEDIELKSNVEEAIELFFENKSN